MLRPIVVLDAVWFLTDATGVPELRLFAGTDQIWNSGVVKIVPAKLMVNVAVVQAARLP